VVSICSGRRPLGPVKIVLEMPRLRRTLSRCLAERVPSALTGSTGGAGGGGGGGAGAGGADTLGDKKLILSYRFSLKNS